jgi:putative membrane protein insertion efficiency factor
MALRAYKLCISPYFRGSCRFLPTCADYAAEAIERHGFLRGAWLAAHRLARCHPLCAAGHDPVPLPTEISAINAAPDFSPPMTVSQELGPAISAGLKTWAVK